MNTLRHVVVTLDHDSCYCVSDAALEVHVESSVVSETKLFLIYSGM